MRCSRFTNRPRLIAGLLIGLLLAIFAVSLLVVPLIAQPARDSGPYYDVSKEVTLSGTVTALLTRPAPGMVWGSHLMLTTASGKVDGCLGRFALLGRDPLSVTPGQQVEVTGVMRTINDKEVFLVRTVKANGRVFTVRNQRGTPVSPQARELAARRGETL